MAAQNQGGSAISQIMDMKRQGLSNNQIIQNLQRAGFTNTQIFDALNQIETKSAVENLEPMAPMHSPMPEHPRVETHVHHDGDSRTEELIEAIIEEKWSDLIGNVQKVLDWKNRAEQRISSIELKMDSMKESFDQLHRAVVGKVSEYDKHILDVGTEIKAMEQVFAKVLPSLTQNVHELDKITEELKRNIKSS